MVEAKGPLDRAADRLGELVHLLKHNVIPGMRPKDQKTILSYLEEMVDDLIKARIEIETNMLSANEKMRIEERLRKEFDLEVAKTIESVQRKAREDMRVAMSRQETELREEFRKAIINQHIGEDDD